MDQSERNRTQHGVGDYSRNLQTHWTYLLWELVRLSHGLSLRGRGNVWQRDRRSFLLFFFYFFSLLSPTYTHIFLAAAFGVNKEEKETPRYIYVDIFFLANRRAHKETLARLPRLHHH